MADAFPDTVAYENLGVDTTITFAQWDRRSNQVARWLAQQGVAVVGDSPQEFGQIIDTDIARWRDLFHEAGIKLVSNVKLFSHLANIGDTRSLIIHPASTTHRQLTDAQKVHAGAGPDVVRVSIGLEDTGDLIGDLEQALDGV